MVTYSSQFFTHRKDFGQGLDYSPERFTAWKYGLQPAQDRVARKQDIGLIMPKDYDIHYFRTEGYGFGNAANSAIYVCLNNVGKYFSKAYNTKARINEFMNYEYHPNIVHADLSSIYHNLKDFAAKKGYKNRFEIKAFSSGFLPDAAIAGVLPLPGHYAFFYQSNKFSDWIKEQAKQHNVSYEASALYTMMHEFVHLFGVGGEAADEATLEQIINEFADHTLKQVRNASTFNGKRQLELARLLREIKRIAASRYGIVYELYGHADNLSAKINENYSRGGLESIVSELAGEAIAKGINTQKGIKQYIARHLKKKVRKYSKRQKYERREASGKVKKSKSKGKNTSGKNSKSKKVSKAKSSAGKK